MSGIMGKVKAGGIITGAVFAIMVIIILWGGLAKNDDSNWQILQFPNGTVVMKDEPGWYLKWFGSIWTYPRSVQRYFSSSTDEGGSKDESIRVTFNDGGTAQISTMIRYQTPINVENRRKAHRDFGGSIGNMTQAVRSHMINVIKATGPMMSASENQSARKAEFTQLVYEQLVSGLYEMRRVERELKDRTDQDGKPITVYATEIVRDENGKALIAQKSPLEEYGITVLQFSITGTEYDQMTRQQFDAKKTSFLEAEKSKAQREQEVQKRLMIVEQYNREKAEAEGQANKEMATATINAERDKEVARLAAMKKVEVAEQERLQATKIKEKALIDAARMKEVAALELDAARLQAQAKVELAQAKQKEIELAGFITERDRTLAEIAAKRDAMVAAELSKVNVPQAIITGSGGASQGDALMSNLINLKLMEGAGLLDNGKTSVQRAIATQK